MNVVGFSGWLEYFAEGDNAGFFAPAIEDTDSLIVPVICIHEVFKKVLQNQGRRWRTVSSLPSQESTKPLYGPKMSISETCRT